MSWFFSLSFALLPVFVGCGIFKPAKRDNDGYLIRHFQSCGPKAIQRAITEYNHRNNIVFVRNITPKEISKKIQDNGQFLKNFFSIFDKEVVCVTWSWEMKKT